MTRKTVSVFGSTGSVGKSTVALLDYHQDKYDVDVLSAHTNVDLLAKQAKKLNAKYAVIVDDTKYEDLKERLKSTNTKVMSGRSALLDMARHSVDWVMMAIVGMAGLEPIFNAIPNGKVVAIANKEPLVAAGSLLMSQARKYETTILPVDSEHNAIFQVFEESNRQSIDKIILTASGGPFRTWDVKNIMKASPEQAVDHPNWSMGAKISVDSASMMNKGLEVIEAYHLFDMPADKIDVLVHPQSIIHSMVQYCDGSILAQMGVPDMSTPIVNALGYPERLKTCGKTLDIKTLSRLTFEAPDVMKFPALALAYECLKIGGNAPLVLNVANEVAVSSFLRGNILFGDMIEIIERVLSEVKNRSVSNLAEILDMEQDVRTVTESIVKKLPCNIKKAG